MLLALLLMGQATQDRKDENTQITKLVDSDFFLLVFRVSFCAVIYIAVSNDIARKPCRAPLRCVVTFCFSNKVGGNLVENMRRGVVGLSVATHLIDSGFFQFLLFAWRGVFFAAHVIDLGI